MTMTSQTRAIALAAALVAVALGLGLLTLSHLQARSGSSGAVKAIKPLHPVNKHIVPAASVHAKARVKAAQAATVHARISHSAPVHAKVKAVVPVTVHHVSKTAGAPQTGLAASGLPKAVVAALGKRDVVVVALYQTALHATAKERKQAITGSSMAGVVDTDQDAFAEAVAGAKAAHAGFVGVDVLSGAQASALVALVGVLPDPAVLVYTRTGALSVKLLGFADRDTVAQAADDAATAPTTTP